MVLLMQFANDITEQKEAIIELAFQNEESEKDFIDLVETTADLITVVNSKGGFIFVNHASINFFGLTPKECEGKSAFQFIHPEDVEFTENEFRKWVNSSNRNTFQIQNRQVSVTGNILNVAWNLHLQLENNIPIKITSIGRDITEQKKAATELLIAKEKAEETENNLSQAQKLAHVGSWIFDPKTQSPVWSNEMLRIWGFDLKKAAPDYDQMIQRIHTEDLELYNSTVNKAIDLGTPYDIEFRINHPDNEQKVLRAICQTTLANNGKLAGLTGTCQDITSQKLFEEAQVKHQRLKAVGEMSASIAHDFNNSLQQMMGNLEIVKLEKNLSDSALKRLNNIGATIRDVSSIVSALQKFGDTKHNDKNTMLINFNSLIEESLNQSRLLWKG